MNKTKYFLFSLICMFCCSIVFAKDEIIIKSITPVYDENSSVIVKDNSVIFNDKDQIVKYNVVLENTTKEDITVTDFKLTTPTEKFLKYEIEGINADDVIKSKDTKEVVVSLETVSIEGWGRNFNDELTALITLDSPVLNPNTSTQGIILSLVVLLIVTGAIIILGKKNKITRYAVLVLMFSSTVTITKALYTLNVPITINVQYESQNVMKPSGFKRNFETLCDDFEDCFGNPTDYWKYAPQIKNFYIENEINEINNYVHKFDVSDKQDSRVIAYLVENESDSVCLDLVNFEDAPCYDLHLQADGVIYPNENAQGYFSMMGFLEVINNLEGLDTSKVTDMSYMFMSAGRNSTKLVLDLSNFDTSNVTDMSNMFSGTGYNSALLELDLSNFDTSNVTNMSSMFMETGGYSQTLTIDLSSFDTSKVTNMSGMFSGLGHNNPTFTLDLSNFDTSNVTNMSNMFYQTGYNSIEFTLDLSSFDTSKVIDMSFMFAETGNNSPNFTLDVSNFDTSNVTDMSFMFAETGYNSTVFTLDVSKFDTSKVTDMSWMFGYAGKNSQTFVLDLSNFDTRNVTDMSNMFKGTGYNNTNFTLDVSNFDTSKVTDMSYMFNYAGYKNPNFTLDVSNFDTSNVTNMSSMFASTGYNSTKLNTSITIRNPNTTSYSSMFNNVATKTGSKITVNYTSATSSLVDSMIATKSSTSNVVKGVQVD